LNLCLLFPAPMRPRAGQSKRRTGFVSTKITWRDGRLRLYSGTCDIQLPS
jgi:hypothetical protein